MSILQTYNEMKLSAGADADKYEVVISVALPNGVRLLQNRMSDVTAVDDHFHITTSGVAVLVPLDRIAQIVVSNLAKKETENG